jgi:glycosyltransferase involved in cell wall biosynthesis
VYLRDKEYKGEKMISIVMPSYNRQSFLPETIDSIIAQSFKDWELIIVDDGSTDDSQFLYDYYQKLDKRIKVVNMNHGGISKARNEGVRYATGEYIAVMDSDDVMVVDRLKLSLKAIKDVDFVYSYYGVFNGGEIQVVGSKPKFTTEDIKGNTVPPHVTIVARRKCFVEHPYNNDFTSNDDKYLIWEWFKAGYKSRLIKKPLVVVRLHGGNVSKTKAKDVSKFEKIVNDEIKAYQDER